MTTIKASIVSNPENNNCNVGDSYQAFQERQDHLTVDEQANLLDSSIKILSQSVKPTFQSDSSINNTGLIIGKIQSGKTMSFTSLIALARDNGYKLVIILSGRQTLLLNQTRDRLKSDLSSKDKLISCKKSVIDNDHDSIVKEILRALKPRSRKIAIYPILKHQNHIDRLSLALEDNSINDKLKRLGVLIIDDEADQASLNTQAKRNANFGLNNESRIFGSIKKLRYSIPNHSFLQYTATPQAPLLIDLENILSPDWHVILKPGEKYTGGEEFFDPDREIIENLDDVDENQQYIPESLTYCIYEYLIISAIISGEFDKSSIIHDKTSMLIHPTWRVNENDENVSINKFYDWTESVMNGLMEDIESGDDLADFEDIYNEVIQNIIDKKIIDSKPKFDKIIEVMEETILDNYELHKVTGGFLNPHEDFPWDECPYHILVGGQLLDRGFTVNDLILTYMPRNSRGTNQADTIEQRCRFYGYRRDYLDCCRVYVPHDLKHDFISYNDSENAMLEMLSKKSLSEIRRETKFFLKIPINLIATNTSRLSKNIIKTHFKGLQTFNPQPPYIGHNNLIIENFLGSLGKFNWLIPNKNELPFINVTDNIKHKIWKTPIDKIIELLSKDQTQLEFNNKYEILKKSNTVQYLYDYGKNKADCFVVEIAPNQHRERTIVYKEKPKHGNNNFVTTLPFGGIDKNGTIYFNDSDLLISNVDIYSEDFNYDNEIIVQIHKIKAKNEVKIKNKVYVEEGEIIYTFAIRFPDDSDTTYITTHY